MDQGNMPAPCHCEQRHRLSKPVDRIAPLLSEQKQDGGNQGPGVANADPPDEIDDGKAPADRDVDSPNARCPLTNRYPIANSIII